MSEREEREEAPERIRQLLAEQASRQQNHRRATTMDREHDGAPERIRLVKRDGVFDGRWYYPDAAIMPFDIEVQYVRASLAAEEGDVIDREAAVKAITEHHADNHYGATYRHAMGNIIRILKAQPAAASSPLPAEPPLNIAHNWRRVNIKSGNPRVVAIEFETAEKATEFINTWMTKGEQT